MSFIGGMLLGHALVNHHITEPKPHIYTAVCILAGTALIVVGGIWRI